MNNNFRELFIGVDEEITIYNGKKIVPINLDNANYYYTCFKRRVKMC